MQTSLLGLFICFWGTKSSSQALDSVPIIENITPDLQGINLRTVFMNDPAFLYLEKKANCQNTSLRNINKVAWCGTIPDIYESLANILNFTFSLYKPNDRKFGNLNQTSGKWNGMIQEVQEDRADVVAAGLVASLERSKAVDFSLPTYTASHVFVVAKGASDYSFSMFFKPLTIHAWFGVYLLILVASFIMYTTVKYSKDKKIFEFSIHKSIIYTFGAFGAFSIKRWSLTPECFSGR